MKIAVIGMGYVGLPLAVEFAKYNDSFETVYGIDKNATRLIELEDGYDSTGEVNTMALENTSLKFSSSMEVIKECEVVIVAVPTPVNKQNVPDFGPLESVSKDIGCHLKEGTTVVYESTVYPGATEEICVPILEHYSNMKWKNGFWIAYSPERINPGDKVHTLTNIKKVVAGDTPATRKKITAMYARIIKAGIHEASSIKVAEAAKVIENTQRDINIAFVNELKMIFDLMDIDTTEVLKAASTKWNFLNFEPGLVGGHCIGVDPYYLSQCAEQHGYHPEMIKAGRRINDSMGRYHATKIIHKMIDNKIQIRDARVLVLGITFKENCPDIRNTKVTNVIDELKKFGVEVDVHDPVANKKEVKTHYDIDLIEPNKSYQCIVLAVKHDEIVSKWERGWYHGVIDYKIKDIL